MLLFEKIKLRKKLKYVKLPRDRILARRHPNSKGGYSRVSSTRKLIAMRIARTTFEEMTQENLSSFIGIESSDTTFSEQLKNHMHELNITNEWLSEETGLGLKTIQRLRNSTKSHPDLKHVVVVCIALGLPYKESVEMIAKAGYILRKTVQEEMIYDYFLFNIENIAKIKHYSIVALCNEKLIDLGYKPLSKIH